MEVQGIDKPFDWSRELVKKVNKKGTRLYYSPSRKPSTTSEGVNVSAIKVDTLHKITKAMQPYFTYV